MKRLLPLLLLALSAAPATAELVGLWTFARENPLEAKVGPDALGDWTFSSTGYTTEAWMIPSADYNRMFLYADGNNTGNALALGRTQIYVMVSSGYDYTTWTSGPLTDSATWNKTWRFLSTVWRNADGDWFTRVYENGASKYVWSGNPNKKAVDFTDYGMGLTSGTEGNGSMNYSVDELRVRRGNSTDDWVQANYDTQVLGSDFLTCGEPKRMQRATIIMVK